jgi:hypothetical protein
MWLVMINGATDGHPVTVDYLNSATVFLSWQVYGEGQLRF